MSTLKVGRISPPSGGVTTVVDNISVTAGNIAATVTLAAKGAANGIAPLGADGLVPTANLQAALVPEEVANDAALAALTVSGGDVGKRLVRVTAAGANSAGTNYLAKATGSGADKWQVYNQDPQATTAARGTVRLATDTQARDVQGASAALVPSVASMQAAIAALRNTLAQRQALAFFGSAGALVPNVSAFGVKDFTIEAWCVWGGGATQTIVDGTDSPALSVVSTGAIQVYSRKSSSELRLSTAGDIVAGQPFHLVYVRGQLYLNGVALGAAITDTDDYTGGISRLGHTIVPNQYWAGLLVVHLYNRALSAADVLGNFLRGAPAAIDYNNATNTSLASGNDSTFGANTGFWTLGGNTPATISGGTLNFTDGSDYALRAGLLTVGRKYRIRATTTGTIVFNGAITSATSLTSNTDIEFIAGATALTIYSASGGTVDNLTIVPLGLLLAPEEAARGCGPQWRDVSGNAAHINLPDDGAAGGITWALPGGDECNFGETRTASGYLLGRDGTHIPAGYRIARIWCSGDGTFSLGGSGGDPASIVNAFTATGTLQPAMLAAYTTSTRKLYLTLGTATTVTLSIHLERI